jgi:putative addiction module killer protein
MHSRLHKITYYTDEAGRKPFREWYLSLRDKTAMQKIAVRLGRLELGNFGVCKGIGGGVMELKIDYGPGYRVYYAIDGETVVLLLIGGDKKSQQRDIEAAQEFWKSHKERKQCEN